MLARSLIKTSTQYLLSPSIAHGIGTGDFTVGGYVWMNTIATRETLWANGAYAPAFYAAGIAGTSYCVLVWWGGDKAFASTILPANAWHHLLLIRRSGTLYVAVNGIQSSSTQAVATSMANGASRIGYSSDGTELLDGRAAQIALWNVGLTQPEVLWLGQGRHGNGRPVLPPDVRPWALVGYWPLDGVDKDFGLTQQYNMAPVNAPGWTGGPPRLIDTGRRGAWLSPAAPTFVPYPRPRGLEGGLSIMAGGAR